MLILDSSSEQDSKEKFLRTNNKTTLMILVICLNYVMGSLIDTFGYLLRTFFELGAGLRSYYQIIGNIFLFSSHCLNFFIFFFLTIVLEKK